MTDTDTSLATRHVPDGLPTRIQHYIDGEFVGGLWLNVGGVDAGGRGIRHQNAGRPRDSSGCSWIR